MALAAILFLTDRFPWPLQDGGNIRTYRLLEAMAVDHQVTLVAHRRNDLGAEPTETPVASLARVCIVRPPSRTGTWFRIINQSMLQGRSVFLTKNWSTPLLNRAAQLLHGEHFDAVHCNHLDTACYLKRLGNVPVIFDSHNCLSVMAGERAVSSNALVGRLLEMEAKRLAKAEANVLSQASLTLACSDQDANHFRDLSKTANVVTVPNGAGFPTSLSAPPKTNHPRLLFVGAMDYRPNVDAMIWYGNHIHPRVRSQLGGARLDIVGVRPTQSVRALASKPGIKVWGRVDNLEPLYEDSSAVVVPLREGGGTRLKIVEAMGYGRPLVCTTKAIEGIDAVPGREALVADTEHEFAESVIRVLSDPTLQQSLAANAREKAVQYDWRVIQMRFRRQLETLFT